MYDNHARANACAIVSPVRTKSNLAGNLQMTLCPSGTTVPVCSYTDRVTFHFFVTQPATRERRDLCLYNLYTSLITGI